MQNQPIARKPVLFQLPTGLYLGMVCYNPLYENLQFVLEKKEFFEVEWPALMISQEKGLFPVLIGLPHITVQRTQILWYATHIPAELLRQYQAFLPYPSGETVLPPKEDTTKSSSKVSPKKTEEKIIPFPLKKEPSDIS
jgi:hypothetical protein